MSSLHKRSRGKPKAKGFKSAADWPSWTDEDIYVPSEREKRWAAENLNDGAGDATDNPPDSYYDLLADEAAHRDRLERGHCD